MGQGQKPILYNLRFPVAPGEVVAIVGPSGAGKSTLVRAIAGAIRPNTGHIRFDGAEQRDWDPDQLAGFVGFMPQETTLFAGSIKDNISRFKVRSRRAAGRGRRRRDRRGAAGRRARHDPRAARGL